jgi:hypothetical protein
VMNARAVKRHVEERDTSPRCVTRLNAIRLFRSHLQRDDVPQLRRGSRRTINVPQATRY